MKMPLFYYYLVACGYSSLAVKCKTLTASKDYGLQAGVRKIIGSSLYCPGAGNDSQWCEWWFVDDAIFFLLQSNLSDLHQMIDLVEK